MNDHLVLIGHRVSEIIAGYGLRILGGLVILLVGWVLANWAARAVAKAFMKSARIDGTIVTYLAKVTRVAVVTVAMIAVLNNFGVQTNSVVAFLGAMGLAIGMALRGTLSNVASGIMLLVLRPFRVGDAVEMGGTAGVVREIGLFATELNTFDGLYVMVPNSEISSKVIINFTRNGTRRVELVIGISYSDDMDRAVSIITQLIGADERVMPDPAPFIKVAELGDSSVNIYARFWTKITEFFDAKVDMTKRIKERFDAEGISIPFPQRELHVRGELRSS